MANWGRFSELVKAAGVDEDTCEYMVSVAQTVVADAASPADCEEDLKASLMPFCDDNETLLNSLVKAAMSKGVAAGGGANGGGNGAGNGAGGEEDSIVDDCPPSPREGDTTVNLQGIILAYGTKSLLQQTNLVLMCGRRYALVGHNGAGKSTLMTRMAANNITGFPKHLRCAYVQHEIAVNSSKTVKEFVQEAADVACERIMQGKTSGKRGEVGKYFTVEEQTKALEKVGFSEEMMHAKVTSLSGGWRMRLAISVAVLQRAHILLLDEPTNHLDSNAVAWLVNYLKSLKDTTIVMVSHDAEFLEQVATDIVLYDDRRLAYYPAPFSSFLAKQEETRHGREKISLLHISNKSGKVLASKDGQPGAAGGGASGGGGGDGQQQQQEGDEETPKCFIFPNPGPLEERGSRQQSRTRTVLKMQNVNFKYPSNPRNTLSNVSVRLTLNSRVGIVGANGAGKSTLLNLIVGELVPATASAAPSSSSSKKFDGKIVKHVSLRIAYVAQHSLHHLEEYLDDSPLHYFQRRFKRGVDDEALSKTTNTLTEEEQQTMKHRGQVEAILGRHWRGRILEYEVKYVGHRDPVYCPFSLLQAKGEYVVKLCHQFDEQMAAEQSGMTVRPITTVEVLKHLHDFGLIKHLATGKINALSGGQRCRLVLAAAMWNRPHVICFDEPTNYLDREALSMLAESIARFKGAVVIVSHNEPFVKKLCNEKWGVKDGVVTVEKITKEENADESVNVWDDEGEAEQEQQPAEEQQQENGGAKNGDEEYNEDEDENMVEVCPVEEDD